MYRLRRNRCVQAYDIEKGVERIQTPTWMRPENARNEQAGERLKQMILQGPAHAGDGSAQGVK
jgi:hypothetical protein